MNYTVMSEEAIRFLCGLIRDVVSLPSEIISNINLSDNLTFSNIHIKNLIDQCLIDANTEAQKLVGALTHLTCEETAVQPTLDNSQVNVIYLYSATGTAPYQQYLKISDTKLIDLGSTSISLSDYLTATQIASTYAKQVDLNTLTDEVNAIKDTIGTETLTTTSQTIKGAINEVAGKSQIITLTKAEYETLATKDPETYYVISDDEDSISISTTVNSASTDSEIPTSKTIYNKSKNKINEVLSGGDIIAYADSITSETVTDTVRMMNGTNSPYGVDDTNNDFHYTIYNIVDDNFKRIVAYDIRKNDMYMILKHSGVWGKWQKVGASSVDNVPRTTIKYDTSVFERGVIYYEVINGICYITIVGLKAKSLVNNYEISSITMPKPKHGIATCPIICDGDGSAIGMFYVDVNFSSIPKCHIYDNVKNGYCTFSYPVAE